MYTGVLKITEENRTSLYQAAVSLNMPDVQDLLLQNITGSSASNFGQPGLSLLTESSKHGDNINIKQEVVDPCVPGTSQSTTSSSSFMYQEHLNFETNQSDDDNNDNDGNDYESDPDFMPKKSKSPSKRTKTSPNKKISGKKRGTKSKSRSPGRKPKSSPVLKAPQKKSEHSETKNLVKTKPVASRKLKCHCGVCGTSYISFTTLKRHMLVKHNSVTPDFYQNRLLYKWYQIQTRNSHFVALNMEVKTEEGYPGQTKNCCKKCGKCFKNYCLLCAHVMKKHAAVCKTIGKDMYHSRIRYISAKKKNFMKRAKQVSKAHKRKSIVSL